MMEGWSWILKTLLLLVCLGIYRGTSHMKLEALKFSNFHLEFLLGIIAYFAYFLLFSCWVGLLILTCEAEMGIHISTELAHRAWFIDQCSTSRHGISMVRPSGLAALHSTSDLCVERCRPQIWSVSSGQSKPQKGYRFDFPLTPYYVLITVICII